MALETADRSWFEPMIGRFERRAFRYALMLTLNRSAAEDLVQEAFERLWAAQNTPSVELGFKRWLFRTITNLARDRHRRRLVESAVRLMVPAPLNPEDEIIRKAGDRKLVAALQSLKLRDRQAIYLRYYQEESFAQIAEILHVKEGTARVIVNRALEKLRQRLNPSADITEVMA